MPGNMLLVTRVAVMRKCNKVTALMELKVQLQRKGNRLKEIVSSLRPHSKRVSIQTQVCLATKATHFPLESDVQSSHILD